MQFAWHSFTLCNRSMYSVDVCAILKLKFKTRKNHSASASIRYWLCDAKSTPKKRARENKIQANHFLRFQYISTSQQRISSSEFVLRFVASWVRCMNVWEGKWVWKGRLLFTFNYITKFKRQIHRLYVEFCLIELPDCIQLKKWIYRNIGPDKIYLTMTIFRT